MDKKRLFVPRLPTDTVPIEGVGEVKVRGMSRDETLEMRERGLTAAETERAMIAAGALDPVLTEDEVHLWQKAAGPDELKSVSNKIAALSGLLPGQGKEVYRELDDDPDAEFRDVPGTEAGDDGGAAASGDARG